MFLNDDTHLSYRGQTRIDPMILEFVRRNVEPTLNFAVASGSTSCESRIARCGSSAPAPPKGPETPFFGGPPPPPRPIARAFQADAPCIQRGRAARGP